jgi:alpha,alpha-trehalase
MSDTSPALTITKNDYDAVIFDLDGVITDTASTHSTAWKALFDEYLKQRADQSGEPFVPFDPDTDYRQWVDGKPRYEGVRSFLESRGVTLPYGDPEDGPEQETICGLGNKKNPMFLARLEEDGVEVYDSSVNLVRDLLDKGIRTAIVSSSKNCVAILKAAEITDLFEVKVDGVDAARLGLTGKPEPDTFLEAVREMGIDPTRAVVVEDAIAGVQAGRAGGFGCVLGIDRVGDPDALKDNGADVVVSDLEEVICE